MKNGKMKGNRGVTLIALVITVIIMGILALVIVNAITPNQIFDSAQKVTNKYIEKGETENKAIDDFFNDMNMK